MIPLSAVGSAVDHVEAEVRKLVRRRVCTWSQTGWRCAGSSPRSSWTTTSGGVERPDRTFSRGDCQGEQLRHGGELQKHALLALVDLPGQPAVASEHPEVVRTPAETSTATGDLSEAEASCSTAYNVGAALLREAAAVRRPAPGDRPRPVAITPISSGQGAAGEAARPGQRLRPPRLRPVASPLRLETAPVPARPRSAPALRRQNVTTSTEQGPGASDLGKR